MQERKFTNELGHDITVEMEAKKIEGVEGILLTVTGPESEVEVHITRAEADVISEELVKFLENS
ncbi:MAG: hypothetical protein JWO43_596 [Candidatus Adlerbacteria bacterium]|nr:hypothetical protein [Candidatus Adlerbacteria bacterium]